MTFAIHRLDTRLASAVPLAPERVRAWQDAFAALDDDAIAGSSRRALAADEWLLIRRLRVHARWRSDEAASDAARLWGVAVERAIDTAVARRDDTVWVRYASRRAAVADLLYRGAQGETARQWAWARMGLITRAPLSRAAVLDAAHSLLRREPELVWPALQRIVAGERDTASLTALLRAWPAEVWGEILEVCPQTAVYARALRAASPSAHPAADASSDRLGDDDDAPAGSDAPALRWLLDWAAARPQMARAHAVTLAVLAAAQQWPGAGVAGVAATRRVQWLQRRLVATASRGVGQPPLLPLRTPAVAAALATSAGSAARPEPAAVPDDPPRAAPAPLPELPAAGIWRDTQHGGVLFWLPRLAESATLRWLDEAEAERPADALRLLLAAVALALGVPRDDAAFDALCGGSAPAAEPPPAFVAHAQALAGRWQAWLDAAAPELAPPRLATVSRRAGRLCFEPGWIELRLPLAAVDTTLRRLGLDLDPGWLPWLGCVVRIVYDD